MQGIQETLTWSLGGQDPLEEEMATLSSILAWKISWTEGPVHGVSKSQTPLGNWAFMHAIAQMVKFQYSPQTGPEPYIYFFFLFLAH